MFFGSRVNADDGGSAIWSRSFVGINPENKTVVTSIVKESAGFRQAFIVTEAGRSLRCGINHPSTDSIFPKTLKAGFGMRFRSI